MVAFFGLFEQGEVLLEHAGLWERHAIDSSELGILVVGTPVGTGHLHDLYSLDEARVGNVSATAEVGKVCVVAEGDAAVFEVLYELGFKRILGIGSQGISLGHRPLAELGFLASEFEHLLVKLLKIPFAKRRSAKVHVVVKSVFNSGTDGEQRVGVKVQNALRQHVG